MTNHVLQTTVRYHNQRPKMLFLYRRITSQLYHLSVQPVFVLGGLLGKKLSPLLPSLSNHILFRMLLLLAIHRHELLTHYDIFAHMAQSQWMTIYVYTVFILVSVHTIEPFILYDCLHCMIRSRCIHSQCKTVHSI